MESIQINGQKIWGPPRDWVGPRPPHGTEVFLKNVPEDVGEDELFLLFSTVGRVYEVRLPVHWTGINKGYAFVRFSKISEADAAIERLNSFAIRQGRKLKVERSLDNTRLFLSSVPNNITAEEIKAELMTVVENVKTVFVYPALENPALFRGYAFVEFHSHRDAAIAKRILTPDVLFNLFLRKCVSAWANPLPFLSRETVKNINILFMRNLPHHFKSISIRLAVDTLIAPDIIQRMKRLHDYAFLTFRDHETAERAMQIIRENPYLLGLMPVHVEWAIPRELVNTSSSPRDPDFVREDNSTEENTETVNSQTLLQMLEDLSSPAPNTVFWDYVNMQRLTFDNVQSVAFQPPLRAMNVPYLQGPTRETDSMNLCRQCSPFCVPHTHQASPGHFAPSTEHLIETESQMRITPFRFPDSDEFYREIRLQNWLQSLTINGRQPSSRATSPTPPSVVSSTPLSWMWDEEYARIPRGRGPPSGLL